ncbi:MAG TPA: Yip1 family protein [Rhodocyclaceae bacterium]|nr:Yip1 family protein [Rhodocyclaceae bacterium]
MNVMMFPRMLSSHDEGWAWLMRVNPKVIRMYLLYVLPLSLLPPAMLLYTASREDGLLLGGVSMRDARILAAEFFVAEMVVVPLMAAVIKRLGEVVEARPTYHDAFMLAAVVPTPLWLVSLALFVPSLMFNSLAMAIALFFSGLLIYEGTYRIFQLDDEGKSIVMAGSILAAGLVAWIALMLIAFVSWSRAIF